MNLSKHKRIVNKKVINECHKYEHCMVCGCDGSDAHHIMSKGAGFPDHKYNLILLCRKCHSLAHENKLTREYLFSILSVLYNVKITENTIYEITRSA